VRTKFETYVLSSLMLDQQATQTSLDHIVCFTTLICLVSR
jgi:hypothetical protein